MECHIFHNHLSIVQFSQTTTSLLYQTNKGSQSTHSHTYECTCDVFLFLACQNIQSCINRHHQYRKWSIELLRYTNEININNINTLMCNSDDYSFSTTLPNVYEIASKKVDFPTPESPTIDILNLKW